MNRIAITLTPLILALTGCFGNSLQPETDPTKGRETLKTVLDTWVNGGTPADLKKGKFPIVAYDPDWEEGHKLTKYDVDATDRRAGVDLLVSVTLFLTRADGKTQEKTVNFAVAMGAQTVVTRKQ